MPVDAERVITQAALNCAEKYFDDEEKQGLPVLMSMMEEFSISSRAKKTNTIVAELLSACVKDCDPRCECISRRTRNLMFTWQCWCNNTLARGPACGVCPPDID